MLNISRFKIPAAFLMLVLVFILGCSNNDQPTSSNNQPPVIDSMTALPDTFVEDNMTTVTVFAHDVDGDNLDYNWTLRESWMNTVGGTDNVKQVGNCCPVATLSTGYVVVNVTDNNGGIVKDSIQIWVEPAK
jgi:hypothetical protein